MKRIALLIGVFLVIAVAIISFDSAYTRNLLTSKSVSESDSQIRSTIEEFWRAALAGDEESLKRTVTTVPDDYYVNSNKCLKEKGEVERRPQPVSLEDGEGVGVSVVGTKGVFDEMRDYEFANVVRYASKIKKKALAIHEIKEERKTEKHAIVIIHYKENGAIGGGPLFLLTKVEGDWKLFLIGSGVTSDDNPYFARTNCSIE